MKSSPLAPRALALAAGQRGIVVGFHQPQLAGKLMSMGVLPGSEIELIRRAPFSGAWYVRVDQQYIALRQPEIAGIIMT